MKSFSRVGVVFCTVILFFAGCGRDERSRGKAFVSSIALAPPIAARIKTPDGQSTVSLQIALPREWKANPDSETLVFEPANRDEFLEAPSIEITTAAGGEASPGAIPGNIARHIQGIKARWKIINTGNAKLDAKGANMEIVAETQAEGEWLLQFMVTYPAGVTEAMYPPRYWIYRYLHRPGEPFFVLVNGKVPLKEADQLLDTVAAACRSVKRF